MKKFLLLVGLRFTARPCLYARKCTSPLSIMILKEIHIFLLLTSRNGISQAMRNILPTKRMLLIIVFGFMRGKAEAKADAKAEAKAEAEAEPEAEEG
jgi:hypothetical protein